MASFIERKGPSGRRVWQAHIRRRGFPAQVRTFDTKAEAQAWAAIVESEIARGVWVSRTEAESTTLLEALGRYRDEILPRKKSAAREGRRITALRKRHLARYALAAIRGKEIAAFIKERVSAGAGGNTVRLDLALISHVFETARGSWGMESLVNPVSLVKGARPKIPRGRDRRLLPGEEARLLAAADGEIQSIVTWAIETGMRRVEIVAMRWEHLDSKARTLMVPEAKTESRKVPLSLKALAVLNSLPRQIKGYVWSFSEDAITRGFGAVRAKARASYEKECHASEKEPDETLLKGLRFHDLRHEATSRFFEKGLNPMEVAAITGHKTLQMLKRYTHLRAEDLVGRLG